MVWSSGYISGPAAVHAAAPFSVLGWRFVIAALAIAGIVAAVTVSNRRSVAGAVEIAEGAEAPTSV